MAEARSRARARWCCCRRLAPRSTSSPNFEARGEAFRALVEAICRRRREHDTFARTDTSLLGRWWWTVDRWTLGAVSC